MGQRQGSNLLYAFDGASTVGTSEAILKKSILLRCHVIIDAQPYMPEAMERSEDGKIESTVPFHLVVCVVHLKAEFFQRMLLDEGSCLHEAFESETFVEGEGIGPP